jgi:hypothetical protein
MAGIRHHGHDKKGVGCMKNTMAWTILRVEMEENCDTVELLLRLRAPINQKQKFRAGMAVKIEDATPRAICWECAFGRSGSTYMWCDNEEAVIDPVSGRNGSPVNQLCEEINKDGHCRWFKAKESAV